MDGKSSAENHGVGTRNKREQIKIDFARSLSIMNTVKKKERKKKLERMWTWKSSSGIKNEIDFIITNKRNIGINVKDRLSKCWLRS